MKKMSLTIVVLFAFFVRSHAQQINGQQIDLEFQKLVDLKFDYEKYKKNAPKRDSVLSLYKNQIYQIKKSSDIYLKHIRLALKKEKERLYKEKIIYNYMSGTGGKENILMKDEIRKIDLYKIIRYCLFKRKDSILPEDFHGLPIVDEKDYNGYDKAKKGAYKIAARFLLDSLGALTLRDKKFIKNDLNQKHVLDMKSYLDEHGVNRENKEFIKWAINYLIKMPRFTLGYVDRAYDAIRYRNYVPRDR